MEWLAAINLVILFINVILFIITARAMGEMRAMAKLLSSVGSSTVELLALAAERRKYEKEIMEVRAGRTKLRQERSAGAGSSLRS